VTEPEPVTDRESTGYTTQQLLDLYRALYSAANYVTFEEPATPRRGIDPLTGVYRSPPRRKLSTHCQRRRTQDEIRADRRRERQARKRQRQVRKEGR